VPPQQRVERGAVAVLGGGDQRGVVGGRSDRVSVV
jgi:hypothetical protein